MCLLSLRTRLQSLKNERLVFKRILFSYSPSIVSQHLINEIIIVRIFFTSESGCLFDKKKKYSSDIAKILGHRLVV